MVYINKKTFDIVHSNLYNLDYVNDDNYEAVEEDFFMADELIALPIQALNRKGYITYISCSGHPISVEFCASSHTNGDISSWIIFNSEIYLSVVPLPPGFYTYTRFLHWTNDERIHIRKDYKGDNVYEIMRDIVESMEQLYEWALKLPDFKSE